MIEGKPRILLVDDEENCLRSLRDVFDLENITCFTANSGVKALDILAKEDIDILITDVKMPGMTGMDLLKEVKRQKPEINVIMLTGYGSINDAVESMKLGAYQYILKPVVMEDILDLVHRLSVEQSPALLEKLAADLPAGKALIGNSVRMRNIAQLIAKIAATDLPVIIIGESGTGKELAATALHYASERAGQRLVTINCAALPDTLLESELFGYEKGAFTDARSSKAGKIEEADKGTLFLDEIGDMQPAMQAKLLRVLEQNEFQRLGSNRSHKVDVRIVSATNRDLAQGMRDGSFRPDLYYRLNAVTLSMPALREIPEDIPILANHFVREFSERFERPGMRLDDEVLESFQRYRWPGNVRELANAIRRAVVLCSGDVIRDFDLPGHIMESMEEKPVRTVEKKHSYLLADVEKEHILKVLEIASGNKSQAAKIMGIHRDTLLRKLKKFGLQ